MRICTDRATEAKQSAARAKNPSLRQAFEELARGGLVLAEQIAWMDRAAVTATSAYRYPIVPSSDASGAGTFIETKGVARGSVENLGNPMACAIIPPASSSE